MGQTRFFARAGKPQAAAAYRALDAAFEDEAHPLALIEIDEAEGIDEVSIYVENDGDDMQAQLAALLPDMRWEREELGDVDWVARSLEGLKPVRAGRFLVHGSHDRNARRPSDLSIEIEAGLAFGTGHHGTTAGCLDLIAQVMRRERPRNALDLGTGSAVLAIAMAKLARIPVLATDIDPIATEVAQSNARLNGVSAYLRCVTAPGFQHHAFARNAPFDLIVANILARPLMRLAPGMARYLTPGGSVILSGILDSQRDAVLAAYVGQRFRHVATSHREGWSTLHLKR